MDNQINVGDDIMDLVTFHNTYEVNNNYNNNNNNMINYLDNAYDALFGHELIHQLLHEGIRRNACSTDLLKGNTFNQPVTKQKEASSIITEVLNKITEDIKQYINIYDVNYQVSVQQRKDGTYDKEGMKSVRKIVNEGFTIYFKRVLTDPSFSVDEKSLFSVDDKSLAIFSQEAGKLHAKYHESLRDISYKKESITQLLTAPAYKDALNNHLADIEKMDPQQLYSNLEDAKQCQIYNQIREATIEYQLKKKTATCVVLQCLNDYFTR